MVTYKEFEIIKHLMLFQGNTTGAFLAYLDQNLHYPVFSSPKEVLVMGGGLGLIPRAEELLSALDAASDLHVTVSWNPVG